MKVIYHNDSDTLDIIFSDNPVSESDEDKPSVILDGVDAIQLTLRIHRKLLLNFLCYVS